MHSCYHLWCTLIYQSWCIFIYQLHESEEHIDLTHQEYHLANGGIPHEVTLKEAITRFHELESEFSSIHKRLQRATLDNALHIAQGPILKGAEYTTSFAAYAPEVNDFEINPNLTTVEKMLDVLSGIRVFQK